MNPDQDSGETKLSPALQSRNPLAWLTIFGPGAVIASLTIGSGELIFSSRAGSLFGYRVLWFFLLVLVLKWVLVFTAARDMVLTGAHPFQRWAELPGPRGWFPLVFFLLAIVCFPIWVCFHAGTIGTLLAWLTGTGHLFHASAFYLWGVLTLVGVLILVFAGGYATLERTQLIIVSLMMLSVLISLLAVKPDWLEFLKGLFIPQPLAYPAWGNAHPELANRPVWVETITYVGVIGGSAYDYLAYVSYLRDKRWGRAGEPPRNNRESAGAASTTAPIGVDRRWVRAPLIDCTLSFLAVLVFSAVFVACGTVILGPQHKIPSGANLLTLQAEFVLPFYPWLRYVYFVGAFLTIFGTLYGTIEVAPAVLREMVCAFNPKAASTHASQLRFWSVLWVGLGGLAILVASFFHHLLSGSENPPGLVALLTPANLFTGVLGCGLICLINVWSDRRFLPPSLRMNWLLLSLNTVAGLIFLALGCKAYWDHSGWISLGILGGTLAIGWIAARFFRLPFIRPSERVTAQSDKRIL